MGATSEASVAALSRESQTSARRAVRRGPHMLSLRPNRTRRGIAIRTPPSCTWPRLLQEQSTARTSCRSSLARCRAGSDPSSRESLHCSAVRRHPRCRSGLRSRLLDIADRRHRNSRDPLRSRRIGHHNVRSPSRKRRRRARHLRRRSPRLHRFPPRRPAATACLHVRPPWRRCPIRRDLRLTPQGHRLPHSSPKAFRKVGHSAPSV
jgi:hypothetical protein